MQRLQNGSRVGCMHSALLVVSNMHVGTEFVAASIRFDSIGQNLQQRGLAAAVRPEQAYALVPAHQ
ncbi:hypothetical protein SDC9_90498 [bioreactor metagenome]|uniref:Uncharacterized protein n=1 Tax=bioreactor metagenome TaxID=1076179 RepID=A0A644ZVA2_9ZZZZ